MSTGARTMGPMTYDPIGLAAPDVLSADVKTSEGIFRVAIPRNWGELQVRVNELQGDGRRLAGALLYRCVVTRDRVPVFASEAEADGAFAPETATQLLKEVGRLARRASEAARCAALPMKPATERN